MSSRRQFLFSTLIFALVPPAVLCGASNTIEYVSGTEKSIPANSVGSFNFDSSKEMWFTYSASVYKLPYEQITSTDIAKGETHHVLRKIPVPSLMPGHKKETLTINYKDATGATGSLSFVLTASNAAAAQETIASKKAAPQATATQSTEWWGDKIWKTNRNKAAWDAQSAQNAPAAQSPAGGTQ